MFAADPIYSPYSPVREAQVGEVACEQLTQRVSCRAEIQGGWLALESLLVACLGKEGLVRIGVCGCGSTGSVRQKASGPLHTALAGSFLQAL